MWMLHSVERIAERIVGDRRAAISESLGEAPGHLDD
jgi:hypothetical protein